MSTTGKTKPYGISNIVSWGATVVIVGLMFKILHWPGATYFIAGGLSTEAVLFFILGFQREAIEIDWSRAYPELSDDYTGDVKSSKKGGDSFSNTAALDKMLADAKIGPELIGSLATGLSTFGDKVASISRVTDAGDATMAYTNKIKEATASYDSMSAAFDKASLNLSEIASTGLDSKSYHEQINKMAKNLSALNAVYELELQDSSNHLKSMNKFYTEMSNTIQSFNDAAGDSVQFKTEVARLAKNMSTLNGIYGNMLSAMNQPRVN
ncbi:MAG TPA: gliding motility protein GldL [Mucilaginibacter sp.]|jgi:gliding motility-associated protein GldL